MLNYKPLRYSLTALFSIGAIVLVGILSFSGMLYLTNNIAASLVSSILAVLIEGEIYKQNIFSGMGMLLHIGTFITRNNYCKKLKKLAKDADQRNNCPLLQDYYTLLEHQVALQHASMLTKILDKKYRDDLARTEKSLAEMEDLFIQYLQDDIDESDQDAINLVAPLFSSEQEKNKMQDELYDTIKKERILLWISMPITVLGGALAVLVTASQLSAAFITFGIAVTPVLMAAAVWPIAIVAAMGFMIMIYKTFVDVIHNRVLQKSWKSFKKLFNEEQSMIIKTLYVLGIVLLTVLACVATIATAGTWWSAAKTGLTLIPFLTTFSNTIKTVIVSIGMSLLGIALFVFDYVNNLESFKIITSTLSRENVPQDEREELEKMSQIKKVFTIIGYNIQHTFKEWTKAPWGVKLNPFTWINRIIAIPFRAALFIGHCISIGVTSDRLGDINAAIPATVCSLQEMTTDLPYIPSANHDHKDHKHEHDHDHNHSDLAGYFLNVILFPTKTLSALWNSAFGDKTFKKYFYKELGIHKQVTIEAPQVSKQWQSYQHILALTQGTQNNAGLADPEIQSVEEVQLTTKEAEASKQYLNSFFSEGIARSYPPDIDLMESSRSMACG